MFPKVFVTMGTYNVPSRPMPKKKMQTWKRALPSATDETLQGSEQPSVEHICQVEQEVSQKVPSAETMLGTLTKS